ncbi:hypothetical protein Vadar_014883 [Vaccinium darrowii]|uniref:Uncharacterized protein n=1 Tax=Vaccinium darrowii TaxID=229202 RepID=A0ACB7XZS0_9ERIC|nr:hypothetical protein Vadar_014883 [Vaccinium darrowii]
MATKKLIAICQSGGEFETNLEGVLSYNGGKAYALDIDQQMQLSDFKQELAETFHCSVDGMLIKFFLPGNKKALITISKDKNFKCMVNLFGDSDQVELFMTADGVVAQNVSAIGMVVKDEDALYGLRLLTKDYPYAKDRLKIWSAIETWVHNYCRFYYKDDEYIQADLELQTWWKELREEGHGNKNDEPWWPKMQTLQDLIDTCTSIIWVGSALHAAFNFGQYAYAGYCQNRPTLSSQFMPELGSSEYKELKENPEKAFLETKTAQLQTLLGISLIEILSRHSSYEV